MPLAVGDSVLLVFSDVSMDVWRAGVAGSAPVQPGWTGKHTMDSPVAIPCIGVDASFFNDPTAAATKIIIGQDGSPAQIRISATDVELGASATDAIALASKVETELGKISTALNSLVAPSGGGPVTGNTYISPGAVASLVIKAQ